MYCEMDMSCYSKGDVERVTRLLNGDDEYIDAVDAEGKTALQYAIMRNRTDIAILLLQRGCSINMVSCPILRLCRSSLWRW